MTIQYSLQENAWILFKNSELPSHLQGPYKVEKRWDPSKHPHLPENSNNFYSLIDEQGKRFSYSVLQSCKGSLNSVWARPLKGRALHSLPNNHYTEILSEKLAKELDGKIKNLTKPSSFFDKSARYNS